MRRRVYVDGTPQWEDEGPATPWRPRGYAGELVKSDYGTANTSHRRCEMPVTNGVCGRYAGHNGPHRSKASMALMAARVTICAAPMKAGKTCARKKGHADHHHSIAAQAHLAAVRRTGHTERAA